MQALRSHWVWLFAILTVLSAADYWDHISRPGSPFEEAPGDWFAFTTASHVSLCVIAYAMAKAYGRLPVPSLLTDAAAFGTAVAVHLLVTGPLWDAIFWQGNLHFNGIALPVLVAVMVYLVYRLVFGFAVAIGTRKPESLP